MIDVIQKLPPELLAEILGHVPAQDALKFKQVSKTLTHIHGQTD